MGPTVVYVHGNGNKPAKEALKNSWDEVLFGAPAGRRSRMAYWADLRYPAPLPDPEADGLEMADSGEESVRPDRLEPAELIAETLAGTRAEAAAEGPAPEGAARPAGGSMPGADLDAWLRDMAYTADALVEGEEPPAGSEVLWLPRAARVAIFRRVRLLLRRVRRRDASPAAVHAGRGRRSCRGHRA